MKKTQFNYCPKCASDKIVDGANVFKCKDCGYKLYFNVACATACILTNDHKILVIKRKNNPGKGKYDLPGGFVDYGETLERGMRRELMEEIGYAPVKLNYFASYPNTYQFEAVMYHTMDCFFTSEINSNATLTASDDAESLQWVNMGDIDLSLFAFDSVKDVLSLFIKRNK